MKSYPKYYYHHQQEAWDIMYHKIQNSITKLLQKNVEIDELWTVAFVTWKDNVNWSHPDDNMKYYSNK
jgi:hypothetical protein